MPISNAKRKMIGRKTYNKKTYGKRAIIYRKPSGYKQNVYKFMRKTNMGHDTFTLDGTNGYYASGGISIALSDLPNATDFTGLFDQYQIRYVKFYFVFRGITLTMVESYNWNSAGMPSLIFTRDHDDITPPAATEVGYDELRQSNNAKEHHFTPDRRVFKTGLKPSILVDIDNGGTAIAQGVKWDQWIDCATTTIPHYGIKYVIRIPSNGTSTAMGGQIFDIYADVYIQCRQTR